MTIPKKPKAQTDCNKKYKKYRRSIKGQYTRLKSAAKEHHAVCTISFEDYIELRKLPCFYECGNPLSEASHSLDRILPKQGYTLDNVVPCCAICNRIKGDQWTVEEMFVASRAVNALRARLAKGKP